MDNACIFVDGENLRHSLVDLFGDRFPQAEYLPRKADWTGFFDFLVKKVGEQERLRTYWYVVNDVDFYPYDYTKKQEEKIINILSKKKEWGDDIKKLRDNSLTKYLNEKVTLLEDCKTKFQSRFDGWKKIQDGISLHHNAVEFRRAGAIRYDLFSRKLGSEKAVDVKLAVDLLELREIYSTAIIVSGDQDYVPAVEVIKDSGKRVFNVSFKTRGGKLLPGGAWRLNKLTDEVITIFYDDLDSFMNFSK